MSGFHVRKVAVLGAGVMGAQIAAHLINVQVPVILFDLPSKDGAKNGVVSRAVEGLKKLKPAPLASADDSVLIQQANYEDDLALLGDCDLVIEAIAERMDWKLDLYRRIAPFVAPHALLASNTSGLSITRLSEALPEAMKPRFCGIHFFNPPRYMALVELIRTPTTDDSMVDALETFVTSVLGKSVVRAKDSPNFIANRIGVAGMLSVMREVDNFGLTADVVDELTGKKLGRASSGTFRTADVVGLDTMAHVIRTLQDNLSLETDPFFASYATPEVLRTLLEIGNLGQKTGAGFFKKVGRDILRFDAASKTYVAAGLGADEAVLQMLRKPAAERLALLRDSALPQARFLWAVLRNSFHYAAVHLASIADNARDVDFCMRWGFGMKQGPFELWQEAGWARVAAMVQEDIDAGRALCAAPLPAWVFHGPVAEAGGVHSAQGAWDPVRGAFVPVSTLAVYARQHFRESVYGSQPRDPATAGTTLYEDASVRIWTLDDACVIASIKTKMHALGVGVIAGLLRGLEIAEQRQQGLVIWAAGEVFSAGADLQAMLPAFQAGNLAAIDQMQVQMQAVMLRLRYANVPVVSAVQGLALGGGCELLLHSSRRVAAVESYVGLVEMGVGLVPGAGGLSAIARRAAENAALSTSRDLMPFLSAGFTAAATAKVSTSAHEARSLGYLRDSDVIVAHRDELLFVAINEAKAMQASGYRAPLKRTFPVAGRSGVATFKGSLVNMRDGGFISAHDYAIASWMAEVVCGGEVEAGTLVTEDYLMALERKAFGALLRDPKTQERVMGMMTTGKPVRN